MDQNPDFNYEQVDKLFPIQKELTEERNKRVIMQLLDLEVMVTLILKGGNL
jgi:hypothetical protein